MQAVILAAGKGTRMKELTQEVPKPMLKVLGKTLLEHKFDILPQDVDEIILIVGYLGSAIQQYFGNDYRGKKITYVVQEELNGTAGALWCAKDILNGKFLVMMGDDIYAQEDITACLQHEWALLIDRVHGKRSTGRVVFAADGSIENIIEGEHDGDEWYSGTNMFALDARLFAQALAPKAPGSSEYGLPQTVLAASAAFHVPLAAVYATEWIQITAPEDIASAEAQLSKNTPVQ